MTSGTTQGRPRSFTIALYVNAALLTAILVSLLNGRARSPLESIGFGSAAFGQQAPLPIAGGGGFYLMPAQFATNSWGCYVMDVDAQTLLCYVYDGGGTKGTLRFAAARGFGFDRKLRSYNTLPSPYDAETITNLEQDTSRRPANLDPATRPTVPN